KYHPRQWVDGSAYKGSAPRNVFILSLPRGARNLRGIQEEVIITGWRTVLSSRLNLKYPLPWVVFRSCWTFSGAQRRRPGYEYVDCGFQGTDLIPTSSLPLLSQDLLLLGRPAPSLE